LVIIFSFVNKPTSWYIIQVARPKSNFHDIPAKEKVLKASLDVIRAKGYSATTVDDLCSAAGVSKGTFFHYFNSKEDLAIASANYWSLITGQLFQSADYHKLSDPLDRVLAYLDFRIDLLRGELPEFTCLVGTLVQEIYDSNPHIRIACRDSIFSHAKTIEKDIGEAKKLYAANDEWSPKSLALHTQAVIQGAFILAKASESSSYAAESIKHLKIYFNFLFNKRISGARDG
jgi:TetR/AcrR family transcriptional regulator, transcriptional repressor for nem operon